VSTDSPAADPDVGVGQQLQTFGSILTARPYFFPRATLDFVDHESYMWFQKRGATVRWEGHPSVLDERRLARASNIVMESNLLSAVVGFVSNDTPLLWNKKTMVFPQVVAVGGRQCIEICPQSRLETQLE
jgi:hypothetical protein